jgi:hypothetical protein
MRSIIAGLAYLVGLWVADNLQRSDREPGERSHHEKSTEHLDPEVNGPASFRIGTLEVVANPLFVGRVSTMNKTGNGGHPKQRIWED